MKKQATLLQKYNENTQAEEWALVAKDDPNKILRWYGISKPKREEVIHDEMRVQYFKNLKKAVIYKYAKAI